MQGRVALADQQRRRGGVHQGRLKQRSVIIVAAILASQRRCPKIRAPVVDLAEVSAGGGSIVWVDGGGALRVGPKSAGADPRPSRVRSRWP